MPKSPHTLSPPRSSPPGKANYASQSPDDGAGVDKMAEVAIRKKKNADAQAAFRQRRANYIATLEQAVEKLEDALTSTQEGRRMALDEAARLKQDNERLQNSLESLRHETREREKYLRSLWYARKGGDQRFDDYPPPPSSFGPVHMPGSSSSSLGTPVSTPTAYPPPYNAPPAENMDPRLAYPHHNESPVSLSTHTYHDGHESVHGDRSPSLPFVNHEGDAMGPNGRQQMDPRRMHKLDQYPNFAVRDTGWQHGVHPSAASAPDSHGQDSSSASHSPAYIPSPSLTSNELSSYPPRYNGMESAKASLPGIDTVQYMFPNTNNNRSISPTVSSPHTGPSAAMGPQFPFVFSADAQAQQAQERSDMDYHRRHPPPPHPISELALHGGTADITQLPAFAMSRRRISNGPERPMLGAPPPFPENGELRNVAESSSQAGAEEPRSPRRTRRNASVASHPSRSPSPDSKPLSSTLAVLKAHAFGALRRSRTRSGKGKASDGAAKVAMQVLESRGIDFSVVRSKKRQRSDDEDAFQP